MVDRIRGDRNEIVEYPKGYDKMIEKLKRTLEPEKTTSVYQNTQQDQNLKKSKEKIDLHRYRNASNTVKVSSEVIKEPNSPEVVNAADRIAQEIQQTNEVVKQAISNMPSLEEKVVLSHHKFRKQ